MGDNLFFLMLKCRLTGDDEIFLPIKWSKTVVGVEKIR